MPDNVKPYGKKSPCNTCPYRRTSELRHWSVDEFKDLLKHDQSVLGTVYRCHKLDGNRCIGWLMDQDKRYLPSIALRLDLSKKGITRAYLDKLRSRVPLYDSVLEMCIANYPEEFNEQTQNEF